MNPQIIQIQPLENGLGFQATFADGSIKLYNELIAVDFDGEANASYNNSQLGMAVDGITLNAAVDTASQAAILDKLNADAAEDVLYINAADAAELPKASYSTIYVGDTDAFAAYGNFAGIAETTGAFAASTKGDNAFVLTGANFSTDALAATIAHEAGHLMGTVEHDYANDGLTLDDFGANLPTTHQTWSIDQTYSYDGGTMSNLTETANTGGAIRLTKGRVDISNATFNNNKGIWGGAVSFEVSETDTSTNYGVTFSSSTFTGNTSTSHCGGAVNASSMKRGENITFTGCHFEGNMSGSTLNYGSAIFSHRQWFSLSVQNSTFKNNGTGTGAAIAIANSTVSITGSIFSGNAGAIHAQNDLLEGSLTGYASNVTVTNCEFLTKTDTIKTVSLGNITFSGANTFAANVEKVTGTHGTGTINGSSAASYKFVKDSEISKFQVSIGNNSAFVFDNVTSGKIALSGLINSNNIASTQILTDGKIGNNIQVASGVTWLDAESTVNLNGSTTTVTGSTSSEAYMNGNTLFVGYRFNGRAADSTDTTLKFVESHYEEEFGTVTLGCNKTVTGSGTDVTTLNGKIYADGKSLDMSKLSYTGIIYGGNTYTSTTSVSNAIELDFSSMTFADGNTNRIYGGGYVSGGDVTLSNGATVTMSNVTLGKDMSIYGGGVLAAGSLNTGNIALTLDTTASSAGHSGNVYAGVYDNTATEGSVITLGTVSTTITSGSYNLVGNGSRITKASSTQGTSTLNISGGTFASYVYGGAFNYGSNATATVSGDVNFTISGGTFNGLVFGGCAANTSVNAAKTTINGNVNLTINATSNIVFSKTVYAGSEGNGAISGNVNVTFTGDASKITWSSTGLAISGGNQYKSAKTSGRVLNFGDASNGFNGNFSGKIRNRFDSMVLTHDSDITFTSNTILDEISDWTIGSDCSLTWTGDGSCDFKNDSINITAAAGLAAGTYDLFDLKSGSLTGWGNGMTVKFGGEGTTETDPGVYTGTLGGHSCTLSMDSTNNKIQLVIA